MRVLDLFSGIGGFSLGLERAGFTTVAFCEIDPYCQRVLRKHWPHVPIYDDVRAVTADRLAADGIIAPCTDDVADAAINGLDGGKTRDLGGISKTTCGSRSEQAERSKYRGSAIDVICGGFPCQDISFAGKGAGLAGERSGLWSEIARLVGELSPRYVIVENVSALLSRGLDRVLGDLAEIGYDCEWHCIPASYVGAPHRRDRIWLVGYPNSQGESTSAVDAEMAGLPGDVAHASGRREMAGSGSGTSLRRSRIYPAEGAEREETETRRYVRYDPYDSNCCTYEVAHADEPRPEEWLGRGVQECRAEWLAGAGRSQWDEPAWFAQSGMGRISDGVPNRVDRLRCLGNAVVPQVVEVIGRAILGANAAAYRNAAPILNSGAAVNCARGSLQNDEDSASIRPSNDTESLLRK